MAISCLQWPAFQESMAYWPGALWIYCKPEPPGTEANVYAWGILSGCLSVLWHLHTDIAGLGETQAQLHEGELLISRSISVGWRDRQSCWVHNTYSISISWVHCVSIWQSLVTSSGPTMQFLRLKQTKHSETQHFPWPQCEDIPFISQSHIPQDKALGSPLSFTTYILLSAI